MYALMSFVVESAERDAYHAFLEEVCRDLEATDPNNLASSDITLHNTGNLQQDLKPFSFLEGIGHHGSHFTQVQYLESRGHATAAEMLKHVPKAADPHEKLGLHLATTCGKTCGGTDTEYGVVGSLCS